MEGDPDFAIEGLGSLESGGPTDLGFLRSARFAEGLAESRIGALIAPAEVDVGGRPVIRSPAPNLDFARAAAWIAPAPRPEPGGQRLERAHREPELRQRAAQRLAGGLRGHAKKKRQAATAPRKPATIPGPKLIHAHGKASA